MDVGGQGLRAEAAPGLWSPAQRPKNAGQGQKGGGRVVKGVVRV